MENENPFSKTQILRIKPCIIPGNRIGVFGGTSYETVRYTPRTTGPMGETLIEEWKTEKTIANKDERAQADRLVAKMKRELANLGAQTDMLGVVIPVEKAGELAGLIDEQREMSAQFNSVATTCEVRVLYFPVQIEPGYEMAVEGIRKDLTDLVEGLKRAVEAGDPKAIRAQLASYKGLDTLLPDDAGEILRAAMTEARKAARVSVAKVEKKGEQLESVLMDLDTSSLDQVRLALLDTPDDPDDDDDIVFESPAGTDDDAWVDPRFALEASAPDSPADMVF